MGIYYTVKHNNIFVLIKGVAAFFHKHIMVTSYTIYVMKFAATPVYNFSNLYLYLGSMNYIPYKNRSNKEPKSSANISWIFAKNPSTSAVSI